MLVEQPIVSDAKKQLDDFNDSEDKVKSSHISRKKILSWYDRMKGKYPSLKIKIQIDGDLLRAEAEIDKNFVSEGIEKNKVICDNCNWEWSLSEGGKDPYICHKCGHNNLNVENFLGKKVMVYYNLHKHTFSVTFKNKVIMYADYVRLVDVEFRVREGGKEKVRKEKSKNVHAFVIGTLVDYCEFPCEKMPEENSSGIVTYNPYKHDSFVYKNTEEPIYDAKEVSMINKKNKLFVIQEIKNGVS